MQKRLLLPAILSLALPALLMAYPGFGGGKGLFRVQNALVEPEAGLTVSLHAIARNPDFPGTDKSGWIGDLVAPELSYAPLVMKYVGLELFGSWGGRFQSPKSATADGFIWGFHDLKAGGKLSIPYLTVLKLGATMSYTFIGREEKTDWTPLDPEALPYSPDDKLSWAGLATIQLQDVLPSAPNIMVNYGKVAGLTQYGAGVELQGKGFALFAEGLSQQRSGSSGMFDTENGHLHLTPGVAIGSATSGMLKAGYTFSSGNDASGKREPNEIILGLGFATPFGKREPAAYGSMVCKVTDVKSGAALAANVKFPENEKLAPMVADPSTGIFELKKLRIGVYVVDVSAEGYQSQAVPIEVKKDEVARYDFALKPLVVYGTIAGQVLDATTDKPLQATIEFPDTKVASVQSDPATGAFRVDNVPTAIYTVTATVEGYFKGSMTVTVEEGKSAEPVFKLTPTTMKSTLTGKVSDKKTGGPLPATINFPNSSVASITNDPATGVYKTDMPVGAYSIEVVSQDYLSQTAAIVVEKDKPLIKDFELVKKGMTITLKGIYFDVNKTTIKPQSRAALADAAQILKDNPSIKVEIQGHTDSQGSDEYNMKLSEGRAGAVVAYLIKNFGIEADRLTPKGYGETMPIADNSNADGRSLNRRVEFVILQ